MVLPYNHSFPLRTLPLVEISTYICVCNQTWGVVPLLGIDPVKQNFECEIVNIFLPISVSTYVLGAQI